MSEKKFRFVQHEGVEGAAYLKLLDFPLEIIPGVVPIANSIDLHSMIENYDGPRICIDFNSAGRPIGIEIVYSEDEYD